MGRIIIAYIISFNLWGLNEIIYAKPLQTGKCLTHRRSYYYYCIFKSNVCLFLLFGSYLLFFRIVCWTLKLFRHWNDYLIFFFNVIVISPGRITVGWEFSKIKMRGKNKLLLYVGPCAGCLTYLLFITSLKGDINISVLDIETEGKRQKVIAISRRARILLS